MKDFKVIEVKRSIFEDNNADADRLREQLKSEGTFNVFTGCRKDNNIKENN